MRHNKLICMLLTIVMLFAMVTPVMAGEDIAVRLDDKFLNFEVKPQIVNDRTMVPLRPILEALNATIEWDDTTKTVTSTKGNTTIKLTMNDPVMYVNGVAKTLDSPACLIQDRTLVPARAISEAFGISVGWDFRSRIVLMSSTSTQIKMYKPDGTTTYVEIAKVDEYKGNNWFVAEPVAMYNEAGETKYVEQTDVKDNEKEGWSKTKPVKIYTLDGRTKYVKPTEVEAYKKVGWYDSPIITIYAEDGRTKKIPTSQKEAYFKVGWYDSPVITVYTEDGRTKKIPTSQKEAYFKVGWYDSPVITVYTEDGRTKKIPTSQKETYLKVGWYDSPIITVYTEDGRTKKIPTSQKETYLKVGWYDSPIITVYTEDGRTKKIPTSQKEAYFKVGWYDSPIITVYTEDGRTKKIPTSQKEVYFKVGWYDSPIITVYTEDGRTKKIPTSQKEAYFKVGWYDSPIITVYTEDGRTKKIPTSQKEAYLKLGWYDSPVITIYAEDGKTKKIPTSQKEAYLKLGWYDSPIITVYSADGRTKKIGSNEKAAYLKVGWYETPVVTVKSLDGRSKVIKKTDLEAYKKVGWYHIPLVTLQTEQLKKAVMLSGTNITSVKNYINPSDIQQFKYKDEGIAYAYMDNNKLVVSTPSKTFKVTAKYSSLGDVIADDNGNIYVVWGEEDKTTTSQKAKTIFISKYNEKGEHVVTTGFEGEGNSTKTNINTKIPFYGGNCDSVITPDGKLVVTYGRKMYNGHQSNNVIAVRISTMTKTSTDWKIPYTSHSFNQRVIWSNLAKDLVFADLGDASDRGFVITIKSRERNVFNFYLQPDANYNMSIVNKTFAQLGGLVETDKGVVLIGASAKSIGPAATKEVQNLFVQVINPNVKTLGPEMFVGGTTRTGKTSPDINDTKEKDIPLKEVTDYGVQWITNSTTHNVVGPHSLVVNNKIVILWNNVEKATGKREAYYTVLASDGKIVVPPTSLGKDVVFNSAEDPIYHNGRIYWIAMKNGNIQKMSINMPE